MAATDIPRMIGDAALHAGYLLAPKPMAGRVDTTGRYVLVTGASQQSLGYEVARTLACWGAHVVVTCFGDPVSLQQALRDDLDKVGGSGSVTAQALDLAETGIMSPPLYAGIENALATVCTCWSTTPAS